MGTKFAHKSAKKPRGKPFAGKEDPRNGRGPKKGSGGRPSLEYRRWLESMEPQARENMEEFLDSDPSDLRYKASADVFDRLHGKANQPVTFNNLSDLIALARQDASGEVENEPDEVLPGSPGDSAVGETD